MKCLVLLLLLGVCAAALVSAKSRYSKTRRQYNDDEFYKKRRQCEALVFPCLADVMKYEAPGYGDPMVTAVKMYLAGSKQLCGDILTALNCTLTNLNPSLCPYYFSENDIAAFTKGQSLARTFCEDRKSELEDNWNCLIDVRVVMNLPKCEKYAVAMRGCQHEPLIDCVADLYKNHSFCDEDAVDFIKDFLTELLKIASPASQSRADCP